MRSSDWLSTGAAWWPEVSPQSLWDLDTASPRGALLLVAPLGQQHCQVVSLFGCSVLLKRSAIP